MALPRSIYPLVHSLLLSLPSLFPLRLAFSAEEVKSIQAEGVAAILQSNLAVARDAAIEDALRKRMEQAAGAMERERIVSEAGEEE